MRAFVAFLAVLAVVGLLAFGLLNKGNTALKVGDPVPSKQLPMLGARGVGKVGDYRGSWVLVNLWASWCIPCRQEAPILERLWHTERKHGLTVLGINVQDNSSDALAFIHTYDLTFPQLRSVGSEMNAAFGTSGVPENFLVNPRGRLAWHWPGPVNEPLLEQHVIPVVEKAKPSHAGSSGGRR